MYTILLPWFFSATFTVYTERAPGKSGVLKITVFMNVTKLSVGLNVSGQRILGYNVAAEINE